MKRISSIKFLSFFAILLIFSVNSSADVIVTLSSNSYVNWTKGLLVIEYSSSELPLVGKSFHQDILQLNYSVKRKLVSEAFDILRKRIIFDENRMVEDILSAFPEKRENIISFLEKINVQNFRYFGGRVLARYSIDIFADNGIFDIMKLAFLPREYKEFVNLTEPKEYTGLIISTKKHKFNISLSVKILSKSGKIIYSYADYKGKGRYINFFRSLEDALKTGIFGDRVLYAFPVAIQGENLTDIVIEDNVAEKILSLEENYEVFYNGKVGIIIDN
ncbi:MAG: hypothetical protein RMJ37_00440 [Spirochaetia bacterium]|nr:hypothetical protein [Spirochaetota bacterium]MDW8111795.1 hypothetical protein [Spirochaetia bacterium]